MNFQELIEKRYAVKNFSPEPVDADKLNAVLEAARLAPSAKNAQCWRIYVLKSPEAVAKVDQLTPCRYHAPAVLLFTYDQNEAYVYPDSTENSGVEDCSIAAVHVMFEAVEQGLGTCWVNRFNPKQAEEAFQIPVNEKAVLLMPIGYPAETAGPLPNHKKKKSLNELVKVL